jgi:hypothetical protein
MHRARLPGVLRWAKSRSSGRPQAGEAWRWTPPTEDPRLPDPVERSSRRIPQTTPAAGRRRVWGRRCWRVDCRRGNESVLRHSGRSSRSRSTASRWSRSTPAMRVLGQPFPLAVENAHGGEQERVLRQRLKPGPLPPQAKAHRAALYSAWCSVRAIISSWSSTDRSQK